MALQNRLKFSRKITVLFRYFLWMFMENSDFDKFFGKITENKAMGIKRKT